MVGAVVVIDTRSGRGRHPHRGKSADGQVLGGLLVLGGVGWLVQQSGLVSLSVMTMLSVLLLALGIGLVLTARRSGGAGLVLVGLLLTVVLASASAVDAGVLQRGVGERNFVPTTAAALGEPFQLGVGSLTLDLSSEAVRDELAGQRVRVQVGVGEIVVVLPPRDVVPVHVVGEARAGEIDLLSSASQQDGGTNLRRVYEDERVEGGPDTLDLDLDVGLGSIQVIRSAR
jgi:hypothetical protein